MSTITAEDAFRVLAKWSRERAAIHVTMTRSVRQRAASAAVINQVLPHSQKVLLTMRDENGDDVAVTMDLGGAEWTGPGPPSLLADSPQEESGSGWLAATFPNGSRYVFGELLKMPSE
jgi:hypothetical protein